MSSPKGGDPISAEEAVSTHMETAGPNSETKHESVDNGYLSESSDMHQGLKPRHIGMIALAGAIGTGFLFDGALPRNRSSPCHQWTSRTEVEA